jgi:Thrombospondin type 3 repeat
MRHLFSALYIGGLILSPLVLLAADWEQDTQEVAAQFESYADIRIPPITEPTVIQIPITGTLYEYAGFAVINDETGTPEPMLHRSNTFLNRTPLTATHLQTGGIEPNLTDEDPYTFTQFAGSPAGVVSEVHIQADQPVTATGIEIELAEYSRGADSMWVRAGGPYPGDRYLVTPTSNSGRILTFPSYEDTDWYVSIQHTQPLRITEIRLNESQYETDASIRFLARPGESYSLYMGSPESYQSNEYALGQVPLNETIIASIGIIVANPQYTPFDTDQDTVNDDIDNCYGVYNPDQRDRNRDGTGDACEDADYDGVVNAEDNCPENINDDQSDTDGDGFGDVCDTEESRFTERNAWVPWVGMGIAGVVILLLFASIAFGTKPKNNNVS